MKKRSFRTRILLALCLSVLGIAVLMVPTISLIYYNYQKENIDADNKAKHDTLDDSLTSLIEDANYVSISIFSEDNLASLHASSNPEELFQRLYVQQPFSRSLFEGISYCQSGKDAIYAKSEETIVLPEISKSILNRVLHESDSQYPISYCLSTYNETGSFLVLGKKVEENQSACFMYLNGERLMQIVDSVVCLDKNMIIDSKRNVVLSNNASELGAVVINGIDTGIDRDQSTLHTSFENVDSYITIHTMKNLRNSFAFQWQIVSIQDYSSVFGLLSVLTYILIGFTIVAFAISVVSSFVLSRKITKPLTELSEELSGIDKNLLSSYSVPAVAKENHDEIDQLEDSYHEMMDRIRELMEDNMDKMNKQRILELESLQMQIKPHFLYNTLDTISWLAKISGEKEIDSLVMSLAKFFRLTLHSGDKIIAVKEELEITKHYLEIQSARFPDRFDYSFDVDDTLRDERTLKLILQPVVENSVKYGFDPDKGKMMLKIATRRGDGYFEYIVIDDGIGFDVPDNLFEKKKNPEDSGKSTGFGLYNVEERIRLEYGESYGMQVTSKVGEGTMTVIRLPLLHPSSSPQK